MDEQRGAQQGILISSWKKAAAALPYEPVCLNGHGEYPPNCLNGSSIGETTVVALYTTCIVMYTDYEEREWLSEGVWQHHPIAMQLAEYTY